jgi:hypothetical protein
VSCPDPTLASGTPFSLSCEVGARDHHIEICWLCVCAQTTWVVDESGKGNFTSLDGLYSWKVRPGDIVYMRGT